MTPRRLREGAQALQGPILGFETANSLLGEAEVEECLDWFNDVEANFEAMEVPKKKQMRLVGDRASSWWRRAQAERRKEGKKPIWKRMKNMINNRYLPRVYALELYNSYRNCIQGTQTKHSAEFLRSLRTSRD